MGEGATVSFRYFVLGLLAQQPLSGYDIKRLLKGLEWLIGSPSFGSLYPALHALREAGLVTVTTVTREGKPPRKIYTITATGQAALQTWAEVPATAKTLKDFVMQLILASSFSPERMRTLLQQRQAHIAEQYIALQRMRENGEFAGIEGQLALDYALALAASELQWLEQTIESAVT